MNKHCGALPQGERAAIHLKGPSTPYSSEHFVFHFSISGVRERLNQSIKPVQSYITD